MTLNQRAENAALHLGKTYDAWKELGRYVSRDPEEAEGFAFAEIQRHLANAQAEVLGLRQELEA